MNLAGEVAVAVRERAADRLEALPAGEPGFAIRDPRFAPDGRAVRVELAGWIEGPGTFECFDVTGRRVGRIADVRLEKGFQRFEIALPGPVVSGVYFARLRQGGRVVTARMLLLE